MKLALILEVQEDQEQIINNYYALLSASYRKPKF